MTISVQNHQLVPCQGNICIALVDLPQMQLIISICGVSKSKGGVLYHWDRGAWASVYTYMQTCMYEK